MSLLEKMELLLVVSNPLSLGNLRYVQLRNYSKLITSLLKAYAAKHENTKTRNNICSSFTPLISIKVKTVKEPNSIFQAK